MSPSRELAREQYKLKLRRLLDGEPFNLEQLENHDADLRARVEELKYELSERAKDCVEHIQDLAHAQIKLNTLTDRLAEAERQRDAHADLASERRRALQACEQRLAESEREVNHLKMECGALKEALETVRIEHAN